MKVEIWYSSGKKIQYETSTLTNVKRFATKMRPYQNDSIFVYENNILITQRLWPSVIWLTAMLPF